MLAAELEPDEERLISKSYVTQYATAAQHRAAAKVGCNILISDEFVPSAAAFV